MTNKSEPGGLCLNIISFPSFETRGLWQEADRKREGSQGWWNFLWSRRQVPRGTCLWLLFAQRQSRENPGGGRHGFQVHPVLKPLSMDTRVPQAVAVSLAEPSAKNQWCTAHVGASNTAGRCYFSPPPPPLIQPGETAHFRQDALPKSWCNPGKKICSRSKTRIWFLPIENNRDQWRKHCRYRRYVEFTHIQHQRPLLPSLYLQRAF